MIDKRMAGTPIGKTWENMIQRCNNKNSPNYKNYGGRGITVCSEWQKDRMTFYEWAINNGYAKGLSIDRIDNDGNYEPNNCRWSTKIQQNRNRRLKNSTSGHKGVYWDKSRNKWQVQIVVNKSNKHIGHFADIEQAIAARKQAETSLWK